MRSAVRWAAAVLAAACALAPATWAQGGDANGVIKTPIMRADQLPRLPSELLVGSPQDLLQLADALERDLLNDLARFDIRDQATLRHIATTRMNIAALRGDWAGIAPLAAQVAQVHALQDKPGSRLTSGLLLELVTQIRREGRGANALQALTAQRSPTTAWEGTARNASAWHGGCSTSMATPAGIEPGHQVAGAEPAAQPTASEGDDPGRRAASGPGEPDRSEGDHCTRLRVALPAQ